MDGDVLTNAHTSAAAEAPTTLRTDLIRVIL
jgi:hypothetical protein